METKICNKCNEHKNLCDFSKSKNTKDGYVTICKRCLNEYAKNKRLTENDLYKLKEKEYRDKNKEKLNTYNKKYKEDNKDKINQYIKKYHIENKDKISEKRKSYYILNKNKFKENFNKFKIKNPTYKSIHDKKYRLKHKNKLKEISKKFRNDNPKYHKNYMKFRRNNDILFKLKSNITTLIHDSFRYLGYTKNSRSHEILGCSFEEFKLYIESKFESWMNWDNKGNWNGIPSEINTAWDIDHIIPLDTAKTEEDVIKLNHYTNLQPLCSYTNRWIKKNNII